MFILSVLGLIVGTVVADGDADAGACLSLIQTQAARQMAGDKITGRTDAEAHEKDTTITRPSKKKGRTMDATRTKDGKLHHILFLLADDLRPEVSAYGHPEVKSPHIQSLADHGFTFKRAYVQQAVCGPSRTAILTGRRPDTSRIWGNTRNFRETTGSDWSTLPQFFKENGWRSIGIGKVYHETLGQDEKEGIARGGSWSVKHKNHGDPHCAYNPKTPGGVPANKEVNAPWYSFRDGKHTVTAIEWIRNASKYDKPFFLAVGFHLPHIPYIYPKEFEFTGNINFPPKNFYITKDIPAVAVHDWTDEGALFNDLKTIRPRLLQTPQGHDLSSLCTAVPMQKQMEMKQAYLSSVQYIDYLVGQLLKVLVDEHIYDQTTVVLLGDHGYKLGEHCEWFKHDLYDISNRFPLIMKPSTGAVGAEKKGHMMEQLVESVDIYPTLIELTGLKVPGELEGRSFAPLFENTYALHKTEALSQYPHWDNDKKKFCMGYSIRTQDWRYTEWLEFDCELENPMNNCVSNSTTLPRWDKPWCGIELYDHRGDALESFEDSENENLAGLAEHADLVADLHEQLVKKWVHAAA